VFIFQSATEDFRPGLLASAVLTRLDRSSKVSLPPAKAAPDEAPAMMRIRASCKIAAPDLFAMKRHPVIVSLHSSLILVISSYSLMAVVSHKRNKINSGAVR